MSLTKENLMELYRKMLVVRAMEEMHARLLQERRLLVMGHFGKGQEAVAVGVTGPLRQQDVLFGTHRGVGEFIGKGMTPPNIWREYLGKKTSLCKGKAGLHLTDARLNIPGIPGSLGADFGMAVGAALAAQIRKTDQVILFFGGDGTFNQGDAHPAMCMAALWKLPLVFAICTNQFCEYSYLEEVCPTEDVAPRAAGYGIPFEIVDGQEIEKVYEAAAKAVGYARDGKGPYVIEYKTFRMLPHFSGEQGEYVHPEDLEKWGKRDPIDLCRGKLLEGKMLTAEADGKLREEVRREVEEAFEQAFSEPDPTEEDLFTDVYVQGGIVS